MIEDLKLSIVLNLVISGIPSIPPIVVPTAFNALPVLNLVISGIPSIHHYIQVLLLLFLVLNLVISGIPSILGR